jgi:ComF family protein
MVKSLAKEIFTDFISLFFPRYCFGCDGSLLKGEEIVCTSCMLEMPQTHHHQDQENPLKTRVGVRINAEYIMAMFKFSKSGRIQHLLHALKYKNHPEIGEMFGRVYGQQLKDVGFAKKFDLIVSVPLHPTRLRKRGYNQSEKFAKGLAEILGIGYSDHLMVRNVKTETQTTKTKLNRWENVSEVFRVKQSSDIKGKRILLVDDVVTTGATLEACGEALLKEGCSSLSIACIAEA